MEWLTSLLGDGLGGGLLGLTPKLFQFIDSRQQRKHELVVRKLEIDAEKSGKLSDERIALEQERTKAFIASIESQTQRSSTDADSWWFKLPDAWNAMVRPFVATGAFLVVAAEAILPGEPDAFVANIAWMAITWYFVARDMKWANFGGSPEKSVPVDGLLRAFGPVKGR